MVLAFFSANRTNLSSVDSDTSESTLIGSGYNVVDFGGLDPNVSTVYDPMGLLEPSGRSLLIPSTGVYRLGFSYSNGNVPASNTYIRVNGVRTNITAFVREGFAGHHGEGIIELQKDDQIEYEIAVYDLWQVSHFVLQQLSITLPEELSYLQASLNVNQSVDIGDHTNFDNTEINIGTNITLNTSDPYTTTNNVKSAGRISLSGGPGKRYKVMARFWTGGSQAEMDIVDVEDGSRLGAGGIDTTSGVGLATTIVEAYDPAGKLIELRKTAGVAGQILSGANFNQIIIEELPIYTGGGGGGGGGSGDIESEPTEG